MHKYLEVVLKLFIFFFLIVIITIRTDPYYLGVGSRGYIAGIA
jgi:hypothetical protein